MATKLPEPIAAYLEAANSQDVEAVAACFGDDSVVRDEGRERRGIDAIREWAEEVSRKYQPTAQVIDSTEDTRRTVVTAAESPAASQGAPSISATPSLSTARRSPGWRSLPEQACEGRRSLLASFAMPQPEARRVDKPWGTERIWAHTERLRRPGAGDEPGKRLSLQEHVKKDESIYVVAGRLRLHLEDDGGVGADRRPRPRRAPAHRAGHASTASRPPTCRVELLEVSTPELDDVVRIEDDFGRKGDLGAVGV